MRTAEYILKRIDNVALLNVERTASLSTRRCRKSMKNDLSTNEPVGNLACLIPFVRGERVTEMTEKVAGTSYDVHPVRGWTSYAVPKTRWLRLRRWKLHSASTRAKRRGDAEHRCRDRDKNALEQTLAPRAAHQQEYEFINRLSGWRTGNYFRLVIELKREEMNNSRIHNHSVSRNFIIYFNHNPDTLYVTRGLKS